MQIVRTVLWVLLLVGLLVFSAANWTPVTVDIWDGVQLDTRIPALLIIAFLIGLVPMWLYHRTVKWRLRRRIAQLEAAQAQVAAREDRQVDAARANAGFGDPEPLPDPADPDRAT